MSDVSLLERAKQWFRGPRKARREGVDILDTSWESGDSGSSDSSDSGNADCGSSDGGGGCDGGGGDGGGGGGD